MSSPYNLGLSLTDIIRLAYESGFNKGKNDADLSPEEMRAREQGLKQFLEVLGLDDIYIN